MENRAQSWNGSTLVQASKKVLINSVLSSLPIYQMGCFSLPIKITDKIDAVQREFWWGKQKHSKGYYPISWGFMCEPVEVGGLGFKEANKMNKAMIAKLAWRLATQQNTLLGTVLKNKYFKTSTIFNAKKHYKASWMWGCIMQGVSLIHKFSCWEVGDGKSINIWTDIWIPGMEQNLTSYCGNKHNLLTLVSELLDSNTKKWNVTKVKSNFTSEIADKILGIRIFKKLNGTLKQDRLRWLLTNDGNFTIKSMYKKLKNPSLASINTDITVFWKSFWKLNVSQRIKNFLWKCIHNALPVRKKLSEHMDDIDVKCVFCDHECESLKHLFFECSYAKSVALLPPVVGINHSSNLDYSFAQMYSNWLTGIYENSEIEILATKCWLIWKERCLRIFQSKSTTSIQLSLAVQRHLAFWSPLRQLKQGVINNTTSVLHSHIDINASRWSKPQINQLKINFDAS